MDRNYSDFSLRGDSPTEVGTSKDGQMGEQVDISKVG